MHVGEGKEGRIMIDYIVEILFGTITIFFFGLVVGFNYAEEKAWKAYEQHRLAVTRERMHRIHEEW